MAYLYIVVAVSVLFVLMHKFTELDMKQKAFITAFLMIVILAFYIFEKSNAKSSKELHELRFAFEQGKTLVCDGKEVNNKLYNYASRSLVGKKGTKAFGSLNIAISHCKIRP